MKERFKLVDWKMIMLCAAMMSVLMAIISFFNEDIGLIQAILSGLIFPFLGLLMVLFSSEDEHSRSRKGYFYENSTGIRFYYFDTFHIRIQQRQKLSKLEPYAYINSAMTTKELNEMQELRNRGAMQELSYTTFRYAMKEAFIIIQEKM